MSRQGLDTSAGRLRQQASDSRRRAAVLRQVLVTEPSANEDPAAVQGPVPVGGDSQARGRDGDA